MDLKGKFPDGMLHSGCFDLTRGGAVTMPTSGSLDLVPEKDAIANLLKSIAEMKAVQKADNRPIVILTNPHGKSIFDHMVRQLEPGGNLYSGKKIDFVIFDDPMLKELPRTVDLSSIPDLQPKYDPDWLASLTDHLKGGAKLFEEEFLCKPLPEPVIDHEEPDRRHIRARASAKDIKRSKPWERL